jgi:hypothetical protein
MDVSDVQKCVLEFYGIRVEPEMARYLLRRLQQAGGARRELPVIGGNARTGVPVRLLIDPSRFVTPAASPAAAAVS